MNKTNLLRFAGLLLVSLLAGCAIGQMGAMSRAHAGLADKRYEFTLKRLAEAEQFNPTTPDLQAEISYMKAQCYDGLNKSAEAVGMYRYVAETFPKSEYSFMARERMAALGRADRQ